MIASLVDQAWSRCREGLGHSEYRSVFCANDDWRQDFQLLTAAFIHSRHALRHFPDASQHWPAEKETPRNGRRNFKSGRHPDIARRAARMRTMTAVPIAIAAEERSARHRCSMAANRRR